MQKFRPGEFVVTSEGTGEVIGLTGQGGVFVQLDGQPVVLLPNLFSEDEIWSCDK